MDLTDNKYSELRNPYVYLVSAISLVVLGLFVMWRLIGTESLKIWAVEDGPIENTTALLYGIAAIVFTLLAFRKDQHFYGSKRWQRAFLLIWAVACFVMAGEEISWGQRIFGIETPAALAELNHHEEINFHNLNFVSKYLGNPDSALLGISAHPLIMAFAGFFFPLMALTNWGRRVIQKYSFPVIPTAYVVLIIGALLYGKMLARVPYPSVEPGEVREFLWGIAIFLFAGHGYLRPWDLYRADKPGESDA